MGSKMAQEFWFFFLGPPACVDCTGNLISSNLLFSRSFKIGSGGGRGSPSSSMSLYNGTKESSWAWLPKLSFGNAIVVDFYTKQSENDCSLEECVGDMAVEW